MADRNNLTNLVSRLRDLIYVTRDPGVTAIADENLFVEAADRIEQLEIANQQLLEHGQDMYRKLEAIRDILNVLRPIAVTHGLKLTAADMADIAGSAQMTRR